MKLARKITIGLALGIFCVMAVSAYLRVEREVGLFEAERLDDERMVGRILRAAVEAVRSSEGDARAAELIAQANDTLGEVQFRWVWLDDASDPHRTVLPKQSRRALTREEATVRTTTQDRVYV